MSDLHAPASNRLGGTFYGVGLGPGDPELMTLKAHRLISNARIIAYPAPDDGESFARSIAADAIRPDAREIPIVVPMRVDRFPARAVYDKAAEKIGAALDDGHDVVTLCEGDPFFYGSFMYLFERLSPRFACEIVPGVTSLTACAARLGRPLTARNDVLTVIPGPLPDDEIRPRIEAAGAVAIMKSDATSTVSRGCSTRWGFYPFPATRNAQRLQTSRSCRLQAFRPPPPRIFP